MKQLQKIIQGILPFFVLLLLIGFIYKVVELAFIKIFGSTTVSGILISLITMTICGIFFLIWYYNIYQKDFGFFSSRIHKVSNIITLLLLGLGSQLFVSSVLFFIEPLIKELMASHGDTIGTLVQGHPIVVVLYSVIVAPVVEELVFRGIMLNKFLLATGFINANILQAVFFSIYHGNVIQGIYAFAMGCLLGYVCYRYKSLLASIVVHSAINASAFLIMMYPQEQILKFYIMGGLIGAFLLLSNLYRIKKRRLV